MPTQKSLKRNLYERLYEGKYLPKKLFKQFVYQKFSKDSTKLWGDILCQKNLKKNLNQTIFQETFAWRKISTKKTENKFQPKKWRTSPPKNLQTIMTRNITKIRTDEIWGKHVFLLNFITFDSYHFSDKNNLICVGGDFCSETVFGRDSFGWTFCVSTLLQIWLITGFSNLVGEDLFWDILR